MGELTGKVALVTGSSRGLGKGVALVLAEKGADVVVNYNSSRDEAEDVCKAVREFGVQSICVQANVEPRGEHFRHHGGELGLYSGDESEKRLPLQQGGDDPHARTEIRPHRQYVVNGRPSRRAIRPCPLRFHERRHSELHEDVGPHGRTIWHHRKRRRPRHYQNRIALQDTWRGRRRQTGLHRAARPWRNRDVGLSVAFLCGEGGNYLTGICLDVNGGMYMH